MVLAVDQQGFDRINDLAGGLTFFNANLCISSFIK